MANDEGVRGSRRVLIASHTTGYQLRAFNDAAERVGIELVFATDRCHRLDDPWQDRAVAVRFHELDASVRAIVARARQTPVHGVIAVGDRPVVLAARAAEALGIAWHSVAGAIASTDKRRSRAAIAAAGLPSPRFEVYSAHADFVGPPADLRPPSDSRPPPSAIRPPCVLKPVGLSGSRGVIRANDESEFRAAFERIRALLARPAIRAARSGLEDEILVEEYIDGREFALEGVMTAGALQTFAVFDKPDPLVGPFFEETIYVTPSSLDAARQADLAAHVARAAAALGLRHGPVHAECRVTAAGRIYILEVAARPIGGLCSRVLTFVGAGAGASLEAVLLRHALGEDVSGLAREARGAAVMMIPIPRRGMLHGVSGEEAAREVAGVTEIRITAKIGQLLEPLPEAGSYLGFVFARGETARDAETAVRAAHARLAFEIARDIPVR
jgi:biotin carboxylase